MDDLPRLTEIYNHYVLTSPATFDLEPFRPDDRHAWISHYRETGRHRLLVAESGSVIAGYITSSRFRPKPGYDTTVEITVYCHPEFTGMGIGSTLLGRLLDELGGEDVNLAVAGVVFPNEPSLGLFRKFGFTDVGTFSQAGQKFGRYWDVMWLEKELRRAPGAVSG